MFTLCVLQCSHCNVHTVCVAVFTLGNNAYGQCGRRVLDNEDHRSVTVVFKLLCEGHMSVSNLLSVIT